MSIVRYDSNGISYCILDALQNSFFHSTASNNRLRLYTGTMPTSQEYIDNGQAFYDSEFVCEYQGFEAKHAFPSLSLNIGNPTDTTISAQKSGTITWGAFYINGQPGRGVILASVGNRSNTDVIIVEDLSAVQGQDVSLVRAVMVLQPTQEEAEAE